MNSTYLTLQAASEGLYKEKGSRFIAAALPVGSEEEVKEVIAGFRKQYHDARHVCYAYMLGPDRTHWRSQDDGEPSGTAGRPILGQINALNLTNVIVVVVRYFGGILLGTSGLINAYRTAAADALQNATVVERDVTADCLLTTTYEHLGNAMGAIKEAECTIVSTDYQDTTCTIRLTVKQAMLPTLQSKVEKLGRLSVEG